MNSQDICAALDSEAGVIGHFARGADKDGAAQGLKPRYGREQCHIIQAILTKS
jgi:hypothetical protein